MSEHGAALQTYNQELVKSLENLKSRRNQLFKIMQQELAERDVLEKNILTLRDKMNQLNTTLKNHKEILNQYDSTINETESGFRKILESSQTLLQVVQQESSKLGNNNSDNGYSPGNSYYSI